jgi:hypothetical protein
MQQSHRWWVSSCIGCDEFSSAVVYPSGKKEEDMAGMGGWESFYNWGKNKLPLHTPGEKVADAQIPPPPPKEEEDMKEEDPAEGEL